MKIRRLTQSILTALATASATLQAATITVTTTASGTDASDGHCSLAEAIDNANADAGTHADCTAGVGADTIELPSGQIITLQERLPLIDSDLTISGNDATVTRDTTVSCSTAQNPQRFGILAVDSSVVTVRSLTVTNGCESYSGASFGFSKSANGIAADNAALILESVTLQNNDGTGAESGGISVSDSYLEIRNSSVSYNTGVNAGGIGVFSSDVLVVDSAINENRGQSTGSGNSGGGIYATLSDVVIENSQLKDNSAIGADEGGGIFVQYSTLTLEGTDVSGNEGAEAGGIYAFGTELSINRSTLSSNRGTQNLMNQVPYSAIKIDGYSSSGVVVIANSTISGNTGGRSAIGVYYVSLLDISDSTFFNNVGAYASALNQRDRGGPSLVIDSDRSIFAAESGDLCNFVDGTTFNISNSLATDNSCGPVQLISNADLALGPLQNNGGPTPTHAIGLGSSALNAGGNDCAPSDQRDAPRPTLGACDAGSYEYQLEQFTNFVVNEIGDNGNGVCSQNVGCTLRDAVLAAEANSNPSSITFDQSVLDRGGTVTLTQGALDLTRDTTLVGNQVTITRDASFGCNQNTTTDPGEFRHFNISNASVSISDLALTNGCADGPFGSRAGGSITLSGGSLNLSNVSVTRNTARGAGGAIQMTNDAELTADNSVFSDNRANGGGVFEMYDGTLLISNSTLSNNRVTFTGGVGRLQYGANLSIINSTIANNEAGFRGSAFYLAEGQLTVMQSTLANNPNLSIYAYGFSPNPQSITVDNSVIQGQCELTGVGTINITDTISTSTGCTGATLATEAEINLGSLTDNGGPTLTLLPQPGSVLIDAAAGCSGRDQRGAARDQDADGVVGNNCDIGAVEVINLLPIGVADTVSVSEDAAALSNTDADGSANADPSDDGVLVNDVDPADDEDAGSLTVVALNGLAIDAMQTSQTAALPSGAQLTLNQDGSFSFDGAGDFEFLAVGETSTQTVTVTISDGLAQVSTPLNINVIGANDAPVASNASFDVNEDDQASFAFPGTDVDAGDALTFSFDDADLRFTNNGDGGFSFNAAQPEFQALAVGQTSLVEIGFTATDGSDAEDSGTITVQVNGQNDLPVAVDDSFAINENAVLSAPAPGVLANDLDPDDEPLTVTSAGTFVAQGIGGMITIGADGAVNYTPPANTSGQARLLYTVSDGSGSKSLGEIVIDVSNLDDPPSAADDFLSAILEDSGERVIPVADLLANDDAGAGDDSDSIRVVSVSAAAGVTASLDDSGTIDPNDDVVRATPLADFFGDAVINYTIEDEAGTPASASVRFEVTPVNDPPVSTIAGDLNFGSGTTGIQIVNDFVNVISLGPNESDQMVERIDIELSSDSNNIVDLWTISTAGQLALSLTGNEGEASFIVRVFDTGGIANGGLDEGTTHFFRLRVGDEFEAIFSDRFESTSATPAITKSYSAGQATLSRDELLSRLGPDGDEAVVLETTDLGGDQVRFAMVDARIHNGELKIRIRRMVDGTLTLGAWTAVTDEQITVDWR